MNQVITPINAGVGYSGRVRITKNIRRNRSANKPGAKHKHQPSGSKLARKAKEGAL